MRRFLIASLIILCSLLPLVGLPVTLDCPAELSSSWERISAAHPLPAGIEVARALPERASATDVIAVRLGAGTGLKVVDRILMAPVARLGEQGGPLASVDAAGRRRTAPLDSIQLPDIALAAGSMTADQPGYPLQGDVAIGVEGGNPELRAWLESLPQAPARATPARIAWIGAVGDIMPARGLDQALLAETGPQRVFTDTLPLLRSFDLLVGNLEAAATARGTPANKTYTFRFRQDALQALKAAGFSYLSIANNHTFDFGKQGFLDTLDALRSFGIGTSGAGSDESAAAAPFETRVGDLRVNVLSFAAYPVDRRGFDGRKTARARHDSPGSLWLDESGLAAAARAFSRGSFNIALVHGGEEWSTRPTAEQLRSYRALVHAGADLVIGSHPHVLQPMEGLDGSLIAYSLGNFLFPGMEDTEGGDDSAILKVGIVDGSIRYVQTFPVRLSGTTVRLAPR